MKATRQIVVSLLPVAMLALILMSCGPTSYSDNIVDRTISVSAGAYAYYSVVIASDMQNARLVGSFTASGGSGNDVKVDVMDQTNFTNYANGHEAQCLYASGQVTAGSFNVALSAAGTYHIVYDNTFSLVSSKQVTTKVDLNYEQ